MCMRRWRLVLVVVVSLLDEDAGAGSTTGSGAGAGAAIGIGAGAGAGAGSAIGMGAGAGSVIGIGAGAGEFSGIVVLGDCVTVTSDFDFEGMILTLVLRPVADPLPAPPVELLVYALPLLSTLAGPEMIADEDLSLVF